MANKKDKTRSKDDKTKKEKRSEKVKAIPKLEDIPDRPSTEMSVSGEGPQEIIFENIIFDLEDIKDKIEEWYDLKEYSVKKRKAKQKVTPKGYEIKLSWKAYRPADRFAKYHLDLDSSMTEVNDIKGSKSLKHGTVKWSVSAVLELDYEHDYVGSNFLKLIGHFYKEYIYSETEERHKKQLGIVDLGSFKDMLKLVTSKYMD